MLDVTKEQLLEHLRNYFTAEVESCPLNAQACVHVLFSKYTPDPYKELGECILGTIQRNWITKEKAKEMWPDSEK